MKKVADEKIEFVHGSGRKKPFYQSVAESLEENIRKLEEYKEELAICGERNSYSKTDKDATFMRLKEDPMLNGQLKPAYNVQHCLDSDFIVWITLSSHPTDTMTLPSTLDDMYEHLGFRYKNVTADAGYESEENYVYLEGHGQLAYIKPNNYEISKTRKYKKDIGRSCNMKYDADEDSYTCKNGKKLTKTGISHVKHKSGYVSETTIYKCAECKGCPYKTQCIKGNNCKTPMEERNKVLYVSKKMEEERAADLERLVNDDGIRYRLNRSIQAEGSFAVTKEDLKFRRYLCRHFVNVQAESILIAIAYDVLKLDEKVSHGRLDVHYHPKSDVKDGKNRSNAA